MRKQIITSSVLNALRPQDKPYFVRDKLLPGFAVKVYPTGRLKFFSVARQDGLLFPKTLGEHHKVALREARNKAMEYIAHRWGRG